MIEKINIKNVASYDEEGIEFDLENINYIYGSNGTGKTTITEFLRSNYDDPNYLSCNFHLKNIRTNPDIFVYNKHFVTDNFSIRNEIKGIFTLGKESTDLLAYIQDKKLQFEKHVSKIERLEENKEKMKGKLDDLEEGFMNRCWDLKLKYDGHFKEAFTGFRGRRERFMEKCLEEAKKKSDSIHTYEELLDRVESVFQGTQDKFNQIQKVGYNITSEEASIFQTKIIGKREIDIAELISKLNISDWVQQGHHHLENSDGLCPFCQQELQLDFKEKLDEYFDETYTSQLEQLNSSVEKYKNETLNFIKSIDYLKEEATAFVNMEKVGDLLRVINSTYETNKKILESKQKEPSRTVKLSSIKGYIDQVNEEIEKANQQISKHNQTIDNIKEERRHLTTDIWSFIVKENKRNYQYYKAKSETIIKAISGMDKGLERKKKYKGELNKKILGLQSQLTSVLPSINDINKLLNAFGFTNFELAESGEKGNYKIVRENGDDANETLSEGEKTFITFLYFYQLINGSNDQSKINTERIIVIDDPISSLDSNILFIVSNLINGLKRKVRDKTSMFKQLLLFTHNVYFHKEVSFNKGPGNQKRNDETFFILRKVDNITQIKKYKENPIRNSYELLWKELKENQNSITTPNIMRRILENYFKFFGNLDVNEIIEKFPDEDKVVCNSLLTWAHDGSHHVNDDLYVDSSQEQNKKYFDVFKRIFINSKHKSHYIMMMGESECENGGDTIMPKSKIEVLLN